MFRRDFVVLAWVLRENLAAVFTVHLHIIRSFRITFVDSATRPLSLFPPYS